MESSSTGRASAAFLDRDGVLNRKAPEGSYITTAGDLVLLDGAIDGLKRLAVMGMRLIVVTNQRGVARGLIPMDVLAAIHEKLRHELAAEGVTLDAIYVCPHEKGACDCRKPQPGLLLQALRDFPEIDAGRSVLFGDSDSDLEAARRAGVAAVRVAVNGSLDDAVRRWQAASGGAPRT
jgi:D-glycero-D-manno-heptose 1,7-bisphosphate phosphatase